MQKIKIREWHLTNAKYQSLQEYKNKASTSNYIVHFRSSLSISSNGVV